MKPFVIASLLTIAKLSMFPDAQLLMWLMIAISIDLLTGIGKSYALKKARTSKGLRQTVVKLSQYGGAIIVSMILANTAHKNTIPGAEILITFFNNSIPIFMIYIEVTSIFENLFAMNPNSIMSQRVFKPVLNLLTFQLKNNPATQLPDPQKETTKNEPGKTTI